MLTDRQRRLIMLLMTAHGWQTSEQLAEQLGVSGKLVKQEVAAIRRTAGASCAIESSTHRGYRLARLADALRHELVQEFDVHEGHHSITHRYARLFVYLVFADAPESTARLARRFLCSKSSIAEELEIVRYRVGRMGHLSFTMDARRGVRVAGPERELRYEASKWLLESFLEGIPFEPARRAALGELIERLSPVARRVLAPVAAEGRISGEDVARTGRYLAIMVWRSRGGHRCAPDGAADGADIGAGDVAGAAGGAAGTRAAGAGDAAGAAGAAADEVPALVQLLVAAVEEACGYRLDAAERTGLGQLIADAVVPAVLPDGALAVADRLVAFVADELDGRAGALVRRRRDAFAGLFSVMGARVRSKHGALNYQASATMARYPLEGYLAMRFLTRAYGPFTTVKAEATRIALAIADALEPERAYDEAVLFSDESLAVTDHLVAALRRAFGDVLAAVRVLPVCAADPDADAAGDGAGAAAEDVGADGAAATGDGDALASAPAGEARTRRTDAACVFTTDATLAAARPDAIVLPVLPTASALAALRPTLEERLAAVRARERAACWHDEAADAASEARTRELFAALERAGSFVAPAAQGEAVLLTVVRTAVIVWSAAAGACAGAAVPFGMPAPGTIVARSCPDGLRFRGKRYTRVIELALPPEGLSAARPLFDVLSAELAS